MDELYPELKQRGRYIQHTSYDRGPIECLPPFLRDWSRKCVTLSPGVAHTAAEIDGPGLVTRLFVALPALLHREYYREIVVRLFWDGSDHPSVEVPVGDFFGVHHCRARQYHSRLFSVVSGGMVCEIPMPFADGMRLEFEQQGRHRVPLFFYGLGYYELDRSVVSPLRFHAQWRREALCRRGAPYTFLETHGSGYYLGLHLSTQNRRHWMSRAPHRWFLPEGLGMGQLEGWEEIAVDHDDAAHYRGTGTEEYFNTGWYFLRGAFTAPDHGCLNRNYLTGRTASYRYHWYDPVPFRESFHGVFHHGLHDSIAADYSSTAYWYHEGVAEPGVALPAVDQRRRLPPFRSRLWRY